MDELEEQKVRARRIFTSVDDAAIDALTRITEKNVELGGGVWRTKNGFYEYSEPQGSKSRGQFEATFAFPKSAVLEALYHTHPGEPSLAEVFSPHDVQIANSLKVSSYIKAIENDVIKKYMPGMATNDSGVGVRKAKSANGVLITRSK